MSGNSFDAIAQEIVKQQQRMEELEAENKRLQEEIAALQSGSGIFLEIDGKRIALSTLIASNTTHKSKQKAETKPNKPTFLEEVMIDEFANALTSPMGVLQDQQHQPIKAAPKQNSEEQKAALRRDLMGSYILE